MPKIYSDEFKRDAVAMVAAGSSQKKVCRDLGISKTALQTWVRDDRFRSHGMTPSADPDERREMTATVSTMPPPSRKPMLVSLSGRAPMWRSRRQG